MKHLQSLVLALSFIVASIHCLGDLGALDPSARPDTKVGPHYVLALDVSLRGISEEELCKTFAVDKDGAIQLVIGAMPVDKIAVVGLTAQQASSRIKSSISR